MDFYGDNYGENQDGWYRQNMQENGQVKEFWTVFTTNSFYFDPSKFQTKPWYIPLFRIRVASLGFVPKGFGKWQSKTELAVKSFRQEKYMVENQAWKIYQDRVTRKMYQEDKCDCRLSWNCQGKNKSGWK